MQAPLQKKTEVKIYILYVMKNIGYPVEYNRLNDTITADEPITVFSFTECFSELLDTGNIEAVDVDGRECFVITERGINVADTLLYMLIPSVQKIALGAATRLVSFDKRGSVIKVEKREEGSGYRVVYSVSEKGRVIFSVEFYSENPEQAEHMENNIKKNPEGIYKSSLALLGGQVNYLF